MALISYLLLNEKTVQTRYVKDKALWEKLKKNEVFTNSLLVRRLGLITF